MIKKGTVIVGVVLDLGRRGIVNVIEKVTEIEIGVIESAIRGANDLLLP